MLLCAFGVVNFDPEPEVRRGRAHVITEAEYFFKDSEKLIDVECLSCKAKGIKNTHGYTHRLYTGGVYIGCRECWEYQSPADYYEPANL